MGLSSGAAAGLDATLLLRHIKIVQQSRELVSAIRSHATLENIEDAENALDSSLGGTGSALHTSRRELRQSEAEVTLLVLKDIEKIWSPAEQNAKAAELLLSTVRDVVFQTAQLPLMTLVYSQSFRQIPSRPTSSVPLQAWRTRDLCASIAASMVAPSNCFSLFQVALECTLGPLRSTCMAAALADFSEAVKEDGAAFCALGLDELLLFLEDDHLQVLKELEVFDAVANWIEASLEVRAPLLCRLLGDGVRLELMDRGMLAEVDAHPLVVQNKEASGEVARAYMQCCYGALISGQAREPRHRHKPLPLVSAASMGALSVASCEALDVLSTCRKARPADLHTIREDGVGDEAAEVPGSNGNLAMSCVRVEGGIKRKLDMRSPDPSVTPALRGAVAREGLMLPDVESKDGSEPSSRLPSKRRLF